VPQIQYFELTILYCSILFYNKLRKEYSRRGKASHKNDLDTNVSLMYDYLALKSTRQLHALLKGEKCFLYQSFKNLEWIGLLYLDKT
jgi:hypothetical protein